jgi:ribonuclease BN (tRNA processing enzyme)
LTYGGNTSCVEVTLEDGTLVILDAGTGIRGLGVRLAREGRRKICLCLTHLHLDHLEGLGFFAPIWDADTEIDVWGPPSSVRSLEQRITRYFSPPLFPMQLSDVRARVTFHDVMTDEWRIGGAYVSSDLVSHPGPTLGFRIEERGRSLAYIPDHEPTLGADLADMTPDWISGFALARQANVLLHDAQYSESEYEAYVGFGHSSVADAVALGQRASVGRLLLFHHDPLHSDTELEALQQRARELWRGEGAPPALAYEGLELVLE